MLMGRGVRWVGVLVEKRGLFFGGGLRSWSGGVAVRFLTWVGGWVFLMRSGGFSLSE
ncbi:MAG: hypothetical protein M2R45_05449 [Verrucomicrobia subdivision 3 bacterium]|nr:hypothetical protein [Limisphaerales bacterium]MCS1417873.1 hypothetical protein [Limisphaerales bacterium]